MKDFSTTRHHRNSAHVITDRRAIGAPTRIEPTRGPLRARYIRERAADLRLASGALDRDPPPPWDRELSLSLDRWTAVREAR